MLKGKSALPRRIRIVLADDHPLVLEDLRATLRAERDMEAVAAVTDGAERIAVVERHCLDGVPDLQTHGFSGWDDPEAIRRAILRTRVLILAALGDAEFIQMAIERKADGVVLKTELPRQTLTAIRQVAPGHRVFPRAAPRWLSRRIPERLAALTQRRRKIIALLPEGPSNAQIARRLGVEVATVKFHRQSIFHKRGVRNRTEATRFCFATCSGWLPSKEISATALAF